LHEQQRRARVSHVFGICDRKTDHYELAKGNATYNGFEEPMIAFDAQDEAGKQLGEIHVWL
jgi:hypothetical protein